MAESLAFKQSCCIDAGRVYDSCCDRDCLEDLRCYFTAADQTTVNSAQSVRVRSADVVDVDIEVEPVTFNRGYYSCDMTFFFLVNIDCYLQGAARSTPVQGICYFNKKVILFGSEGNVKIFTNEQTTDNTENMGDTSVNTPKCVVQCVNPIALSARLGEITNCYECCCKFPRCINTALGGDIITQADTGTPTVFVTLGIFSIVQLIRNVQMLIPVYDFCIPQKQCENTTDQPCDVFRKIKFPSDDFFPAPVAENELNCNCGK